MKYFSIVVFVTLFVSIHSQSSIQCPDNELYNDCGSRKLPCDYTCINALNHDHKCVAKCAPGCFCKKELVRNSNDTCVSLRDCPLDGFKCRGTCFIPCVSELKQSCSADSEEVNICGNHCERTCENALMRVVPCLLICGPVACTCKEGLVRHSNGTCVNVRDCPKEDFKCEPNEYVNNCGDLCEAKCDDPPNKPCLSMQPCNSPACVCNEGFARNGTFCVKKENCSNTPFAIIDPVQ